MKNGLKQARAIPVLLIVLVSLLTFVVAQTQSVDDSLQSETSVPGESPANGDAAPADQGTTEEPASTTSTQAAQSSDDSSSNPRGCRTQWICSEWSACTNGLETRSCSKQDLTCSATPVQTERSCAATQQISASAGDQAVAATLESSSETSSTINNAPGITGAAIGGGKSGFIIPVVFIGLVLVVALVVRMSYLKRK